MNLKDEMEYKMYDYLEKHVKPGKATKYSKDLSRIMLDNLLEPTWRNAARIFIESATVEILREMGYEKRDDDRRIIS